MRNRPIHAVQHVVRRRATAHCLEKCHERFPLRAQEFLPTSLQPCTILRGDMTTHGLSMLRVARNQFLAVVAPATHGLPAFETLLENFFDRATTADHHDFLFPTESGLCFANLPQPCSLHCKFHDASATPLDT